MQRSLPWDPIVHDLPQTPLLLSGPSLVVGSANHCQYPENVAWTFQNCRTVNIHTVNDLADHPITCWVKSTANLRLYCDRSYLHSSLNCDKTISIFSVPLSFAQPSPGILLGVVLMSRITGILVNTLRPRQNGRHLPDGIFECIFLNENLGISISISLKFVPRGSINNNPLLVLIVTFWIFIYHEIWILLNIFLYETIELFILWHVWRYSGVLWVNSCPPLTRLHQRQSCMSGQALLHHWLCNQKHPWGICSCSPIVNFLKVTFYHEMVSLVIFLIKKSSK